MLTCQPSHGEHPARQGRRRSLLAELQADPTALKHPSGMQRLRMSQLARRLARVQALGGEYAQVDFSPAMKQCIEAPAY